MTIAQTKEKIYTPDEYLELETASATRHEYRNGEIIRTIPSFQEYLRVSQYEVRVEHYVKTTPDSHSERLCQQWLLSEYSDPSTILTLSSLELQLSIADLYENIDFEES